jgi:hypothetical protein
MHGTEHRIAERRAPRRSAPPETISRPQDQCFPARRSLFSPTEPVARNGLLLARNSHPLSEASIPGSMFPACYFAPYQFVSPPGPPICSTASTGLPRCKQLLRLRPVAAPLAGSLGCSLCLHSPPGLLHPSGSKCSTDFAATRLAFRPRPISSRSPQPVLFLGLATDHRSWFATLPETGCSSNLLEPSSLCS